MLTLRELREICITVYNKKPTLRTLLLAAVVHDQSELTQLVSDIPYPLGNLKNILIRSFEPVAEEESLILEIIKSERKPNDLHLFLLLCRKKSKLRDELEDSGLNIEKFSLILSRRILEEGRKHTLLPSNDLDFILTNLTQSRVN